MIDEYWPHGFTKIDKINHYFISNGIGYEAKPVVHSEELVYVNTYKGVQVFYLDELLNHLEAADGSCLKIVKVIEELGLSV
jgi:hypothetical protein